MTWFDRISIRWVALLIGGLAWLTTGTLQAQQDTLPATAWPQWRGLNRDDISRETGLLQEWPEGGPEQLWTTDQGGLGYAGFAVVDDQVFTLGADDGGEFAICLNARDGSVIWRTEVGDRFENRWGDGPRNTPTIDGERVYFLSAGGTLKCLKRDDGEAIWSVSLTEDFGGTLPYWGYSESPLVDGDQLVCTPGGEQGAMIALDKRTGKTIWRSESFPDPCHYSSIVAADINGKRQYVQLVEKAVVGVDAGTGQLLWREDWGGRVAVIPTPIVDDKRVYVTSGYEAGSMLLDVSDSDNVNRIWFSKRMKNHHGGVILLDGHFYGYSDRVGWLCQSAETGEIVWRNEEGLGKGAISYADNRFYLLDEKSGEVVLIAASPEGWQEHGRFQLDPLSNQRKPDGGIWVHPVISNGRLFLRDQEHISCYDISASN
jgi:outer membrane protein assembly factor BamB